MLNYNKNNDKKCLLEVNVEYSKHLHNLHIYLTFFPERLKIKKFTKLIRNFCVK